MSKLEIFRSILTIISMAAALFLFPFIRYALRKKVTESPIIRLYFF